MAMYFPSSRHLYNTSSSSTAIDRQLAADILRCLKRHNNSFDHAGFNTARKQVQEEIARTGETEAPKNEALALSFYSETLIDSCLSEVANDRDARSIALLLEFSTGSAVEWAERTLGLRPCNATNEL